LDLWRELLGVDEGVDIGDAVSDQVFFNLWKSTSEHNTNLYSHTFKGIPENSVSLAQLKVNKRRPNSIIKVF
jgi:hypothetical protein